MINNYGERERRTVGFSSSHFAATTHPKFSFFLRSQSETFLLLRRITSFLPFSFSIGFFSRFSFLFRKIHQLKSVDFKRRNAAPEHASTYLFVIHQSDLLGPFLFDQMREILLFSIDFAFADVSRNFIAFLFFRPKSIEEEEQCLWNDRRSV